MLSQLAEQGRRTAEHQGEPLVRTAEPALPERQPTLVRLRPERCDQAQVHLA